MSKKDITRIQMYLLEYMRLLKIELLNEDVIDSQNDKLLNLKINDIKEYISKLSSIE